MEDKLVVTYDNCPDDTTILTVARSDKYSANVLNKFKGDDAFCIYHLLVGNATIKFNEGINEIMFQLKCIKEHLKFVCQTTDKSVDFDIKVLDECVSELEKWKV